MLTIAVAMVLNEALGTPVPLALDLAAALLRSGEHTPVGGLVIRIDVATIERRIAARLNEAVEANPPARRGRPPRIDR